ncbi:MAG TPA: hypothetical protein VHT91_01900 [Kofleriaceae bacterium]|jgi:hypothetical protein|nr:hypothetical protein [Kofleriaceae bacterium]
MVTPARALAGCAAWLAACLGLGAAGCLDPDYHCTASHDCDVGEAGRCEVDHRCTAYDLTCDSHRRYSDHSGPASGTCFDDAVTPANLCAAGQPPARSEGCAATVCKALTSCCDTGWSEACVQQAQLSCSDVVCDTRIAITATDKMGDTELVDLTWDGAHWMMRSDARKGVLAWLAPAPGQAQPRLAGFAATGSALVYDGGSVALTADRSYLEATSVDFDRDGRPTAVLGYTDMNGNPRLEVVKLDDGSTRSISTLAARLSWGDLDHDAFPDGMATSTSPGSGTYRLLTNAEATDSTRSRTIGAAVDSSMAAGITPGSPAVRGFDWIDANRDHRLDAIAYGSGINVHLGQNLGLSDTPQIRVDCNPPALVATCNGSGTTTDTQTQQSFAGAAVPEATGAAVVIAEFPASPMVAPTLHRVEVTGSTLDLAQAAMYTLPPCTTGTCPPIVAVVARDLDGDHQLDIIAIDSELNVYTALGSQLQLSRAIKLPVTLPMAVFEVRTSVTGAPR